MTTIELALGEVFMNAPLPLQCTRDGTAERLTRRRTAPAQPYLRYDAENSVQSLPESKQNLLLRVSLSLDKGWYGRCAFLGGKRHFTGSIRASRLPLQARSSSAETKPRSQRCCTVTHLLYRL